MYIFRYITLRISSRLQDRLKYCKHKQTFFSDQKHCEKMLIKDIFQWEKREDLQFQRQMLLCKWYLLRTFIVLEVIWPPIRPLNKCGSGFEQHPDRSDGFEVDSFGIHFCRWNHTSDGSQEPWLITRSSICWFPWSPKQVHSFLFEGETNIYRNTWNHEDFQEENLALSKLELRKRKAWLFTFLWVLSLVLFPCISAILQQSTFIR